MSNALNGSRHDYYLYQERGLEQILTRGRDEKDYPKTLANGGYLGMVQIYSNVVMPVKKASGGSPAPAQREFNMPLSRIDPLNDFGRLELYNEGLYRLDRSSLDSLVKICIALTSLKINSPLLQEIKARQPRWGL